MQKFLSVIAILLCSTIAHAQTVPDKVVTQAGRIAGVTITTDGDDLTWTVCPPTNVDVFREYDPNANTIKLRILSYTNGTYYIVVSQTKDKKVTQKVCVVTVGEPPTPGPDPAPKPDDQLTKNLKAVYAADPSPSKADELDALIALYEQGAVFTNTRKDITTYGQLWKAFSDVANNLGCHGKLKAVQQIIANEMVSAGIPTNAADGGTAIDRAKLVPILQRIAGLLKGIK